MRWYCRGRRRKTPLAQDTSVQAEADRQRGAVPEFVTEASGRGSVESFTVIYGRGGEVEHGVVMLRTSDDARALARVPARDGATLAHLLDPDRSPVGSSGEIVTAADGVLEWRVVSSERRSRSPYPLTSCFSETFSVLPGLAAGDADLIAVGDAIGRRDDDAIISGYARGQFDIAAEIAGDGHGLEQHLVVGTDGRDAQAALVEDQGAGRNMQRHGVALQAHAHIGVAARHQLAAGIVERQLHPRRAGGDIDRLRGRLDRRGEGPGSDIPAS